MRAATPASQEKEVKKAAPRALSAASRAPVAAASSETSDRRSRRGPKRMDRATKMASTDFSLAVSCDQRESRPPPPRDLEMFSFSSPSPPPPLLAAVLMLLLLLLALVLVSRVVIVVAVLVRERGSAPLLLLLPLKTLGRGGREPQSDADAADGAIRPSSLFLPLPTLLPCGSRPCAARRDAAFAASQAPILEEHGASGPQFRARGAIAFLFVQFEIDAV